MKFTVNREFLIKSLEFVNNVPKSNYCIDAVHIQLTEDGLALLREDYLCCITKTIPVTAIQYGSTSISCSHLIKLLKSFKCLTVTAEAKETEMSLFLGDMTTSFEVLDSTHYPVAFPNRRPSSNTPQCVISDLASCLKTVSYAQAPSIDTRSALKGICLRCRDRIMDIVAADGYRMAKTTTQLGKQSSFQGEVILPSDVVPALTQLALGQNTLWVDENLLYLCVDVKTNAWIIIQNLIVNQFPPYEQFFFDKAVNSLKFETKPVLDALANMKTILPKSKQKRYSDKTPNIVHLTTKNGCISLTANSTGQSVEVTCPYIDYKKKFETAFDIDFLIDVLKKQGKTTLMEKTNASVNRAIQFRENNSRHLLMPCYT